MKILVIEDDKRIIKYLKLGLEKEGFEVTECYDGVEGLKLAKKGRYDLIIVDVLLPNIDGFTIITKIREAEIQVPIITLTSQSSLQDKVTGLSIGADDYVTKPFTFQELIARINALLRRASAHTASKLFLGNITLNTASRIAYKNNKKIILTRKEYLLLEYFMKNPDKVLSRQDIIDNVWKANSTGKYDIASNIIDVYVKKIRTKIEGNDKNPNPSIESIRGVGYKLNVRLEEEEDENKEDIED